MYHIYNTKADKVKLPENNCCVMVIKKYNYYDFIKINGGLLDMAWDDITGRAAGSCKDKYVVLQVVLTEKFLGTGSGTSSLTNLQAAINKQAALGYRLHTISTTASGSKGFLGGDKIQATMVFERID